MKYKLHVKTRTDLGKGPVGRMRRQGKVPGVFYGKEVGNLAVELDAKELEKVANAQGLIEIELENGKAYSALIREVQRHPRKNNIIHCDLFQVPLTGTVQTTVPLVLEGEPQGLSKGGVFQHGVREIEIECQAKNIPENISVDVSHLDIGDILKVEDLPKQEGIEILTDPETVLASIIAPRMATKEVVEEEAEEAAEEKPAQEEE